MKEKKMSRYKKAGVYLGTITGIFFITTLLILANTGDEIAENIVRQKVLKPVPLGDASLADGATKVLCVGHYPHQATPASAYNVNITDTNSTFYEFYDGLDNEMTGETPYGTSFDVVVKMAINQTHGYNTTSAAWELALFNATMDGITGYNFTSDVAMNEIEIGTAGTGDTYMFVHYYMQDADGGGGNGFQIGQGVNTNATYEFWAYQ